MKPSPRLLSFILLVLCFSPSSAEKNLTADDKANENAKKTYVIISNIVEDDAYFKSVKAFQELHPEASLLKFKTDELPILKKELQAAKPDYCALVLKPEDIDINFQSRFLKLCTEIDDDPFCDFSYGYITGGTAEEASRFVENIAKSGKEKRPAKMLCAPKVGGGKSEHSEGKATAFGLDWPMTTLTFGDSNDSKKNPHGMTEEEVAKQVLEFKKDFSGNGVALFGGHGNPKMIGGGISGNVIRDIKPDFYPAIVYNYACSTGCVQNAFLWDERGDDRSKVNAKKVKREESLCLSILASGATAYIATLEPRPAGPGIHGELSHCVSRGCSLGEARRHEYDKLVLAFLSRDEKGLVIREYKDGEVRYPGGKADPVRDMMMMGALGIVLYGDPAMKICDGTRELQSNEIKKSDDGHFILTCTQNIMDYSCNEPYRVWNDRFMAEKFHSLVELPKDCRDLEKVELLELKSADGKALESRHFVWSISNENDGRKILHLQVNSAPDSLADSCQTQYKLIPKTADGKK